jgi:cytochrome c oxidase cbb3-type subunit III
MIQRSGTFNYTIAALLFIAAASSCQREERRFREVPPAANATSNVVMSPLVPGAGVVSVATRHPYQGNAWAVSQGKRLYNWMNCVGCHSNGGGGIGPPLMDNEWIYGSDPSNIFSTIVEGRPNGMPSFRGKLTSDQVWQLVAYVRTMSGMEGADVRSGRSDHMSGPPVEQGLEHPTPKQSFLPPASQTP